MADFGDDELFLEFEKKRETQETFLHVNSHESDDRIKSHFVFKFTGEDSDNDSSSDEDSGKNESSQISGTPDSNGLDSQGYGRDSGNYETSENAPLQRTSYQESFQRILSYKSLAFFSISDFYRIARYHIYLPARVE